MMIMITVAIVSRLIHLKFNIHTFVLFFLVDSILEIEINTAYA